MVGVAAPGRRRWWILGVILLFVGSGVGASLAWRQRRADPLARGRAAYDRGDWDAASAAARQRLKADRNDRDAVRLLARSSARRGRGQEAMALFSRLGTAALGAE